MVQNKMQGDGIIIISARLVAKAELADLHRLQRTGGHVEAADGGIRRKAAVLPARTAGTMHGRSGAMTERGA